MLRATRLTLARGARRLLEEASLTVHDGHKVGLVGPNGSGKSSLFAAIRGELLPDAGSIDLPAAWTIAHVAQETPAVDRVGARVRDRRRPGAARGRDRTRGFGSGPGPRRRGAGRTARDIRGDRRLRRRARAPRRCLPGWASTSARQADPVASFSGGWRMRLNLAQALMCRSDLLLLDEPTNHLDLDAVLWLEDWLGRYPGTLLLITHDRDFLDGVATTIVHVDDRKLKAYTGNYSAVRARARGAARAAAGAVREAAARRSRTCSRSSTASAPRPPRPSRRRAA